MINAALDVWVWSACLLFLVLLGARAWFVETGQGRLGRTPAKVQVLTGATIAVLLGIVTLLAMQGGALLVESIVTGTDPMEVMYGPEPAAPPAPPAPPAPLPG